MKKLLAIGLSVLLMAVSLMGCGSKQETTSSKTTTGTTQQGTTQQAATQQETTQEETKKTLKDATLEFYIWNEAQLEGMSRIIEGFNKIYPNVKVNLQVIPTNQYKTKLQTTLPSGTGADIFWLNAGDAAQFMPSGLIMELQSLIDRDKVDMTPFPETIKKLYTYEGKLYGIPKDYDTIGLWFNKEMFDKVGLKYPDDTWTWNDVLENAKKLTIRNSDGTVEQYGFIVHPTPQGCLNNFILQNGGFVYDPETGEPVINSPQNIETFKFLLDMINVHKVSPTYAELQEVNQRNMFLSGKAAMLTDGSWLAKNFYEAMGDKLGLAPLPKNKQRGVMIHGLAFVGAAKTKYPEQVWEFLKYCATPEAQRAQAGVIIPAYKGMEQGYYDMVPQLPLKILTDAVSYSYSNFIPLRNAAEVSKAINDEYINMFMGLKDVETALNDAQKNATEAFHK